MSKSRSKVLPEIKSQILSELQMPGCTIPKLVKGKRTGKQEYQY